MSASISPGNPLHTQKTPSRLPGNRHARPDDDVDYHQRHRESYVLIQVSGVLQRQTY
jgi:hypothetical protein